MGIKNKVGIVLSKALEDLNLLASCESSKLEQEAADRAFLSKEVLKWFHQLDTALERRDYFNVREDFKMQGVLALIFKKVIPRSRNFHNNK